MSHHHHAIDYVEFNAPGGRRFHLADPAGNELAVWGL